MNTMKRWLNAWLSDARSAPEVDYVGVCDGIRVLAIGVVAWFHIWQQSWLWPILRIGDRQINFDPIVRAGYLGVDLMILLSGFCLYLPWARLAKDDPSPNARVFYRRRAARILPSYYFCVLLLFFVALAEGSYAGNTTRMWRDLLTHLTFTHVFFYDTYYATYLNAALWTIAIEVHFYCVFPWLARAFRRLPLLTAAGMIAVALAFRGVVATYVFDVGVYFNQLIAYLDIFALGMFAAHVHVRLAQRVARNGWLRLLGDAMAIGAVFLMARLFRAQASSSGTEAIRMGQMQRRLWVGLAGAALLLGAANGGWLLRRLLGNPLTRFLASVSMQFYIWHQTLAVRIAHAGLIPTAYAEPNVMGDVLWQRRYTAACWIAALLVSTVLTYGLEKPIARRILSTGKKGKKEKD